MPRERVHHGKLYVEIDLQKTSDQPQGVEIREYDPNDKSIPKDAKVSEEPSLDVTWSRDQGYVQVSIDMSREQWLTNTKQLEDDPNVIKRAIYTDGLSRQEINHLIRTLRRARDSAFGADE